MTRLVEDQIMVTKSQRNDENPFRDDIEKMF